MVVIYGMIFNVDLKKGRRFLQKQESAQEREQAAKELESLNLRFERIQNKEKTLRMRVIQERGITD